MDSLKKSIGERVLCLTLAACAFLGLAEASAGTMLIEFRNSSGLPVSEVEITETFAFGAESLVAGSLYDIYIDTDWGMRLGRLKVEASEIDTTDGAVVAVCGLCLRRILAGCSSDEELALQGIFWEPAFRFPSLFLAIQDLGSVDLRFSIYLNPSSGTGVPLAQGDIRILAPEALIAHTSSAAGCLQERFVAGPQHWGEDAYLSVALGAEMEKAAGEEVEVLVVSESDYQAGPEAWREVRPAYQANSQRIRLPLAGDSDPQVISLWQASSMIEGSYRVMLVKMGSGVSLMAGHEQLLLSARFRVDDIPGTIERNIWICPPPPK